MTSVPASHAAAAKPVRPPAADITSPHLGQQAGRTDRKIELFAAPTRKHGALLSAIALGAVLYVGWQVRIGRHLTAESGIGYALGIIGGVLMLLLLLYPARKRLRFMRWSGATKYWFRVHMILGVIGPLLILFHANFGFGSLNGNVALISMLLVAVSGLIGRYFYSKIHYGLYGRRATLSELRSIAEDNDSRMAAILSFAPDLQERLVAFEAAVLGPPRTLLHGAGRLLFIGMRTRRARSQMRRNLKRALKAEASRAGWSRREYRRQTKEAGQFLSVYFVTVRKVAEFSFFERLFALWHLLHLPLFFILIIASLVHVLAVHMY